MTQFKFEQIFPQDDTGYRLLTDGKLTHQIVIHDGEEGRPGRVDVKNLSLEGSPVSFKDAAELMRHLLKQ